MLSDPQQPTSKQKKGISSLLLLQSGNQPTGINHPHLRPSGYCVDSNAFHQAAAGGTEHSFKLVKSQLSPRIRGAFGSTAAFKSFAVLH